MVPKLEENSRDLGEYWSLNVGSNLHREAVTMPPTPNKINFLHSLVRPKKFSVQETYKELAKIISY